MNPNLHFASINELYLDPHNPRLSRHTRKNILSQDELLQIISAWTLDELALSYLENGGFWIHEALLVIEEELYGSRKLIVVEGNRRLAALKFLYDAYNGKPSSPKWDTISKSSPLPDGLFDKVPYIKLDSRSEIQSFLGFRHVTGIKQWDADEKAGFIAKLIDEDKMSYEQVMRKIGSKTIIVRQHYLAYRLLLQIENMVEDFDAEKAGDRFAILYMSIQTEGARQYLDINMFADPQTAKTPVPDEKLQNLVNFSRWLFGSVKTSTPPLVSDTRMVSSFGKILESAEAIKYLESKPVPRFDVAFRIAGGDEEEIVSLIVDAADNVELGLMRAHFFKDSPKLQSAVERLAKDTDQLLSIFPALATKLHKE